MKKIFYIFALVAFTFTSCEKNELDNNLHNSNTATVVDNINRPTQPIILGNQLNNPFSVENMQIALDSLMANSESLNGSMRAPSAFNEFEISATDLYIRYLPKDSVEYRTLMNDTTLTLFDFPLDYELKQVGEYYKDPTVTGEYTWLYTRVPVGYTPHAGIEYEVLEELFILEHSPYYSVETETGEDGMQKAKSVAGQNNNEALRVLQTVSLYLTGNLKQDSKDKNTYTNNVSGMQKARSYLTVKIFGKTITLATFYYPSGTLKVKGFHTMNENGIVTPSSTAVDVPLKGVKMHFLTWFYWGHAFTDENGYYQSDKSYLLDPIHTIYFSGRTKNQQNSWDLDRVWLWGSCLWVQKHCLGVQSKDEYNATIDVTSDAWDACVTNNAIYEYMTVCDKEGLARPSAHLQVALRENPSGLGSSSAPLFQNHTNTYTAWFLGGFFNYVYSYTTEGSSLDPTSLPMTMFLNSLPDILLAGGNMNHFMNTYYFSRQEALYTYNSTIWHELTHASNFQRVKNDKGYGSATAFWSSLVGTEGGNSIVSLGGSSYGKKGDTNWQQVGLCEGWANYREWSQMKDFLKFDAILMSTYYGTTRPKDYNGSTYNTKSFPIYYTRMFDELVLLGCSYGNIEKSMTSKTFSGFRDNLKVIYPTKSDSITAKVNRYEAYNF